MMFSGHIVEFLTGLHDRFSHIRNRIFSIGTIVKCEQSMLLFCYCGWYNSARDKKGSKNYANISVSREKSASTGDNNGKSSDNAKSSSQISRPYTGNYKVLEQSEPNLENLVNLLESSGITNSFALTAFSSICTESWIIDTRASAHIIRNLSMLDETYDLQSPCIFILRNGSSLHVTKVGRITLQTSLTLTDVLYIPQFKFNLLSVHKLAKHHNIKFIPFNF